MSEVRVEKRPMPAAPMFPVGRFFGMNPFTMMREFTEEMDNIFKGNIPAIPAAPEVWAPKVDVQRSNGDLVVTAELPGLKKEEVKVEMTEEALVLTGERKLEHKEDHQGYHRYERSYGKFYRSIPLPEGVKTEAAKAELTDGVLKITVPVAEAKKAARQIPVGEPAEKPVAA